MRTPPTQLALRRFVRALALMTTVLAVLVVSAPAEAADNGIWSVEPAGPPGQEGVRDYFGYSLEPGETLRDTVSITNFTDQPMKFKIFPTDAYNTPIDAGFGLLGDDEIPKDVGSWIKLGYSEIEVAPRTRADLAFELTVPTDATPGDHAGGIVIADANFTPSQPGDTTALDIRRRVGARVYVRVAGPVNPELRVTTLDVDKETTLAPPFTGSGKATIHYVIENTGNVRISPTAALSVTGLFGRTIHEFEPNALPELLPGGSVEVTETFEGLPPIDRAQAKIVLTARTPEGDLEFARTTTFWLLPWLYVLILSVIAIAAGGWWMWRRRRRSGGGPDAGSDEEAPAKEPALV